MDFSTFLKRLQVDYKIDTIDGLFKKLGGKSKLGIGSQTFRLIFTGKLMPTLKVFNNIFNQLDSGILKEALIAYLSSSLSKNESKRLKKFVSNSFPIIESEKAEGLFESTKSKLTLTENQLKFLTANRDAMRLFHKLLLDDEIPYREFKENVAKATTARTLEEKGLAKRHADGTLLAPAEAIMLPNRETGTRACYKQANRYILEHIDAYMTDDKENERICYSLQYVPNTVYKTLLDETEAHKKRVQKLASTVEDLKKDPNKEAHVPILLVSFIKKLEKDEL